MGEILLKREVKKILAITLGTHAVLQDANLMWHEGMAGFWSKIGYDHTTQYHTSCFIEQTIGKVKGLQGNKWQQGIEIQGKPTDPDQRCWCPGTDFCIGDGDKVLNLGNDF